MVKSVSAIFVFAALTIATLSVAEAQTDTDCGLHRAFVAETRAPQARDRLEVSVPAAGIARFLAERTYAKKPFRSGAASVGDQVFVQFEACDPARPVILGFARPL